MILVCGHVFCYSCVLGWAEARGQLTCPECRTPHDGEPTRHFTMADHVKAVHNTQFCGKIWNQLNEWKAKRIAHGYMYAPLVGKDEMK